MDTAVRITLYLKESDRTKHGSLHNELLQFLREQNVTEACAFHAVAGFIGRNKVHTSKLIEAGGDLPVIVTFVDLEEHVERVLPQVLKMVPNRMIVRENVRIVQLPPA